MMKSSPIHEQIQSIWCTLRAPDTGDTFLQTISTLWKLLTRSVLLIFLIALLVVASAVWLWGTAFQKGREYRAWLNQTPQPSNDAFLARIGQDLQAFFSGFSTFAGSLARKLLGIPEEDTTLPAGASQNVLSPGSAPMSSAVRTIASTTKVQL